MDMTVSLAFGRQRQEVLMFEPTLGFRASLMPTWGIESQAVPQKQNKTLKA